MIRTSRLKLLIYLGGLAFAACGTGDLPTDVERTALGPVPVPGGMSESLRLELPAADSFMLVVEGAPERRYGVLSLEGPSGVLVSSAYADDVSERDRTLLGPAGAPRTGPNPALDARHWSALLAPNSDGVRVAAGTYTLRLSATDAVGRPVSDEPALILLHRSAPVSSGAIDLRIFIAGDVAFDESALAEVQRIFRQVNLQVVMREAQAVPPFSGRLSDAPALFAQGDGDGLRVFLVNTFDGELAGMSAGIPGAPTFTGADTGVLVNVRAFDSAEALGRAIAHECAHWLGLFHTSEGGALVDPIADTPVGAGERTNLMFPSIDGGSALTPEQGRVIRRHLQVRPTD